LYGGARMMCCEKKMKLLVEELEEHVDLSYTCSACGKVIFANISYNDFIVMEE